jgi:hypothetical protein
MANPQDRKDRPRRPEDPTRGAPDDHSGRGRERRDDGDVFPAQRNPGQFGTHGGPARYGSNPEGGSSPSRKGSS